MQEMIEHMSAQLTERWQALSKSKKLLIVGGVALFLVILTIAIIALSRPKMASIYNQNLSAKQVAEVVDVLDAEKISYTLINNGLNIEVNQKDLNTAKVALAAENVPTGSYEFADAIDNTMSTTESERKAKMHRLAETDLENMLMAMEGVAYADVTLVVPEEKNSFIASKQQSSASVLLTVNRTLTTKQIEGIARLVCGSVTNLEMENVNIMDTSGNTLYIGADEGVLTSTKQQEVKQAAETAIKEKVRQLLEPVYDEVRIIPNLILNFDQYEEMREEYYAVEDGKGIPTSEYSQKSSSTTGSAAEEPGVANNGGDVATYEIGDGTTAESKSESSEVNYANSKVVSSSVKNVGEIDYSQSSLTVFVFKEKVYKEANFAGDGELNTWEAFKEANKDNIAIAIEEHIVESIQVGTGITNVVVYGYETPSFVDEEPFVLDYKSILPFILILLIVIIIVVVMLKFRKHDEVIETEPVLEVESMLEVARQEAGLEEIELKETLETKRQIEKFVDEKPEAVANLLRNWLTEDDWG